MSQHELITWVVHNRVQVVAVIASLALLAFIVELVRKTRLKEAYSLLWLCSSAVFVLFAFWRNGLELLARLVGIAYAPAALFLLLLVAIFLILIQFSVVVSRLSDDKRVLAQELALIREELDRVHAAVLNLRQPTTANSSTTPSSSES